MKGHTNIPYAQEAAALVEAPRGFVPDIENKDRNFWGRTLHFESRYRSIDGLLEDQAVRNVLELSSGFSFRGLHMVQRKKVFYIDTDLPDVIAQKQTLLASLPTPNQPARGTLQLAALNVLDEAAFNDVCNRFPAGPIAIVNEGLLMYLSQAEKEKLCRTIRRVLQTCGGFWITADIYLKLKPRNIILDVEPEMQRFFEEQNVDENRFDSFEAAEAFFRKQGFAIDKEATIDYSTISSFPHLIKGIPPEELKNGKMGKLHTTWRLRLADE